MNQSVEKVELEGNNNDIVSVYTCGVCKTICEEDEVIVHGCLRGYNDYHIDHRTHYFYPMLDILQSQSATLSASKKMGGARRTIGGRLSTIEEESLILAVRKRRPLWDNCVPTDQKSRALRRRLWKEVSKELKGRLNEAECQQKFRSLRDTYRKIINSEYLASGTARVEGGHKWKHYDVMEFIRDNTNLMKDNFPANIAGTPQSSNDVIKRGCNDQEECNSDESDGLASENLASNNEKRQRLMSSQSEDSTATATPLIARHQSVSIIRQQKTDDIVVPPMSQPDEVDGFLQIINSHLREMSVQVRRRTMQEIMTMTFSRL